jgi:chaperonin GroEL
MHATRAAVEEGIVPGGGVAPLRAAVALQNLKLEGDEQIGVNIVKRACEEPCGRSCKNSGSEGAIVVEKVRSHKETNHGFNAATEQYEELVKAGVIHPTNDPHGPAECSFNRLTTEAMICELKEELNN